MFGVSLEPCVELGLCVGGLSLPLLVSRGSYYNFTKRGAVEIAAAKDIAWSLDIIVGANRSSCSLII